MHTLHIVIGETNTLIGRLIRQVEGGEYNHCCMYLDNDFFKAYSFSRRYRLFWFTGCFCTESLSVFSSYSVYAIKLTDGEYASILSFIAVLKSRFCVYNYICAVLNPIGRGISCKYSYICSTFAAKLLEFIDEIELDKPSYKYSPMDVKFLLERCSNVTVREYENFEELRDSLVS